MGCSNEILDGSPALRITGDECHMKARLDDTIYKDISSLLFGWVIILKPFLPTALEGIDLGKSHLY